MPSQSAARGDEPPMFLQRPSTGKSQDVRHILAKTFRELFTRDAVGPDTMKNLAVSKGGDDPYHERYVDALQKVFDERQRRMEEAAMLERHIMQAQARAMTADERELNKASQSCDNYGALGMPPGRSHFRSCIDTELLKQHKLLTPSDYSTEEPAKVQPPLGPKIPSYARETMTSRQHTREDLFEETPLKGVLQRSKSDLDGSVVSEGPLDQEKKKDQEFLAKFPQSDAWKYQLNEDQREQERISLNKLQAMTNYTRNPRFIPPSAPGPGRRSLLKAEKCKAKEIGIQPTQEIEKEPQEHSQVFLVSPPAVIFSEYKVGQVYELTLTLKNVSSCIRQCRALPVSTPYFSVGLGQFPGEHGLVAPGMSCHYAVRFAPDSLRDFEDAIKIQTQSTIPITVPILGRRPPPKLSLPSVIDVGYCLVGGCHVTQLVIKNDGGPGRFCIMPSTAWPTTNFKSVVHNGNVPIPPFDVRPAVLEIGKDDVVVMDIAFQPPAVKSYSVDMCMVCDNCNVKHFTIKGEAQKAGVELVSVERGTTEPLPGELTDATAQHLIRFDNLNPFTYTDRSCVIKNLTNVSLPFQWMIYKPQFDSPGLDSASKKYDRVPDVDSVFSIHPPTGVLPPAENMEFKITYAPPIVDSFHSALHLLLNMVPPSVESISQGSSAGKDKDKDSSGEEKSKEEDDTVSEIILHQKDMAPFVDVTALEIEVKGESTPLNVVLHPYAIHVPGKNLVGTTLKKMVTMANHSHSTITFQWEPYTEKYILEVEPPFGELDPGMAMDMELCITGPEPGKIDHTLYCHVMNLEEPLHLQVQSEFKGPEMSIDEPDINFGLIRLGQTVMKEITVNNMSQIVTTWSIQDSPTFPSSDDDMAVSEFVFEPSGGELKPLESKTVQVTFHPLTAKSVRRVIEVVVEDGKDCNILCFAEVQVAQVCLEHCELAIPKVYKSVPVTAKAKLINQTLLPTAYEWGQPIGEDISECRLDLEPKQGFLGPREEKEIIIQLIATRKGDISDLRVPCKIEGMDNPLILAVFCDVKGLSVSYRVSEDGTNPRAADTVELNFGNNVKLGSTPKLYLHITNHTLIRAHFYLRMKNFLKPPTPPHQRRGDEFRPGSARRMLLGRTPNLADPFSKTTVKANADLCSNMLGEGTGASFVPVPNADVIAPFTEHKIEITAYSDIWGQYTDSLICKIGDLEETTIPVSMTVVGCPLSFQMTASQPHLNPVVRFGSHVAGTATCKRSLRVNNTSPYDIRVDWETYNTFEGDQKLTDLIVTYAKAFPLRDSDGNEIVPPSESVLKKRRGFVPVPIVRQPTDFIPNSEDTSAAVSREATHTLLPSPDEEGDQKKETPFRPKVVSVFCRPHEGQKATAPYSIKPVQMVIPAKGHSNVSLSFTPFPTDDVAEEMDCIGYMLGFMSLDNESAAGQGGLVTRAQTYQTEQLRLDMTAHLKPALLTIECADEEGMRYRSAMSSLLQDSGGLKAESLTVNSVMLSNLTLTPLTFRLVTNKPFLLVELDPSSNKDGNTRAQSTEMHTLKPRHNLVVKVAFQTTSSLLSEIASDYLDNEDDLSGGGRKIELKDNLIVEFNNTAKQLVPLHATLTVPQFTLSKESLDFGTCLVGQTRQLQLMLSNQTSSHTHWSISQESRNDSCAVDTFRVEPVSGLLEAHITHISDSKILLQVFFTAKHAEDYETVFTVHGVLGETPRRLYIRGQGSYDGKHEAILNV